MKKEKLCVICDSPATETSCSKSNCPGRYQPLCSRKGCSGIAVGRPRITMYSTLTDKEENNGRSGTTNRPICGAHLGDMTLKGVLKPKIWRKIRRDYINWGLKQPMMHLTKLSIEYIKGLEPAEEAMEYYD